jgi:hypothetical protein
MKTREPHRVHVPLPRPSSIVREENTGWPMTWFRNWDRFWFKPSDPVVIGFIRLCTGLVVLYVHLMYTVDLLSYVGKYGWLDENGPGSAAHFLRYDLSFPVQPSTWNATQQEYIGHGHLFWSIYYDMENPAWIYAVHFSIVAVSLLFAIGLWTRVTSVLTWIGAMCYLQRAPTLLFGQDTMMNILLIYLMIGPSGAALSVDDWLRRRRERAAGLGDRPSPPLASATVATRLIQINFCYIYLASGTSKLLGSMWWSGTAIWGTIANSYFAPFDQSWYISALQSLSAHRWVWEVAMSAGCVFTLFVEIGLPFLIWSRKWRWFMVCGSVMLHTGIGLCMGLVTFSLFMLCMVIAFFPPEAIREMLGRITAAWRRSGEIDQPVRSAANVPMSLSRS